MLLRYVTQGLYFQDIKGIHPIIATGTFVKKEQEYLEC